MMASFRSFWHWGLSFISAILITVSLFGLMTELVQRAPDRPDALEDIKQIHSIRVKKLAPPPKKEPEKIKKPAPIEKISGSPKPNPIKLKPQLTFQLNSKLPTAPMDLVMPNLEQFTLNAPVLKDHYHMDELDFPLIPLSKIPPYYPVYATRRGIEGVVIVQFLVTKDGNVEQIKIIDAQPPKIFDQSVINCLSKWKFKAGTIEEIPVNTLAQTTIRFNLEK